MRGQSREAQLSSTPLANPIRSKRARSLRGRQAKPVSRFSKALAYSLVAHSFVVTAVIFIGDVDWSYEAGVSNPAPEIAMVPSTPIRPLLISREVKPMIEVPLIDEEIDLVEEVFEVETPEPPPDELLDPLLEEDPFEDLDLDPLQTPEVEAVQEPVGEEPEPVRQLLESPPATYPQVASLRRLEGTVVLRMIVDPSGQVVEVELVSTSGHGSLDRAAIAAARGYRFEPGEGTLTVSKTFSFRLP